MTGASSIAIGLPEHSRSWRGLPFFAKLFIGVIILGGLATLVYGGIHQTSNNIAEFICYLALPFLRSRPPRSLEPAGVIARRTPRMRRLNDAIVGGGSIQVNTIPSGHVAGALAAGLAVWPWSAAVGAILIITAVLIAVAATAGRYHYALDCLLGAGVAIAVWLAAALT
jgi:hypothetical protein